MDERARHAGTDDRAVIEALAQAGRDDAATKRGGPLLVARDLPAVDAVTAAYDVIVLGEIDGVVVGYAAVTAEPVPGGPPLAVIGELFVLPDARGIGVGEVMMDEVIRWAGERGCRGVDAIALPGDRETKNFFETFGLVARGITVHRALGTGDTA